MYKLLFLVSGLFAILTLYYFFLIFTVQTDTRYTRDERVDLILWREFIPIWVSVWGGCAVISAMAFLWAVKLHSIGA